MYLKRFEVRWRDIDANKHLGNSAYIDFMSHTRMSFFIENGLGLEHLRSYDLGPIVFYEQVYYFKEILLGEPIFVSLETSGTSPDARFIQFEHNFYNKEGKNMAYAEMLLSWIDLKTRRLGKVPENLKEIIDGFPRTSNFRILTSEDRRKYAKKSVDLPEPIKF